MCICEYVYACVYGSTISYYISTIAPAVCLAKIIYINTSLSHHFAPLCGATRSLRSILLCILLGYLGLLTLHSQSQSLCSVRLCACQEFQRQKINIDDNCFLQLTSFQWMFKDKTWMFMKNLFLATHQFVLLVDTMLQNYSALRSIIATCTDIQRLNITV